MLRRFQFLLIALSPFGFFSCDDSDEPGDVQGPEIHIVSPKPDQRLARIITVEATAEDQSNITLIKAYLDGHLLSENTKGKIQVAVETWNLAEGTHTLKVMARDAHQNTSEETIQFEVRNLLLSSQVPTNFVSPFEKVIFVLTQNDGTILGVASVENEGELSVPTPSDFNPDSTFVLGVYSFSHELPTQGAPEIIKRTRTFWTGMHAGAYKFRQPPPPNVYTQHKLTLTGVGGRSILISGSSLPLPLGYSQGFGDTFATTLSLSKNSSDLYILFDDGNNNRAYEYIDEIRSGESSEIACCGSEVLQHSSISMKDMNTYYNVGVFMPPSWMTVYYGNGKVSNGKMDLYYPKALSNDFVYLMSHISGEKTYDNNIISSSPPATFQYLNAEFQNVNYANRKLKITATGTYDEVSVTGITSNYSPTLRVSDSYSVVFPDGAKTSVTIPDPPNEISYFEFSPASTFNFSSISFTDYLGLSGRSDYQNKLVFGSDNVSRGKRELIRVISTITPTSNGGRSSDPADPLLSEEMKAILKERLP